MNKNKDMNLFREIFPYTEVPYITFDKDSVEMDLPEDFWITDTTFRDGQQARSPYSVQQIVDLYTLMHELGGPNGIIRYSEFFLYSNKDKDAVRRCQEKDLKFPEITGWIRATPNDFKLVKQMELKETGILTSASDYHIFLKLNLTHQEAMDKYLEVVDAALEAGIIPRCHLEDITRADFDAFVIPFVKKLMERSKESGIPIKIRACDTLGYGVPHPQVSLPRGVPKIIHTLRHVCGVPSENLEWHGHNDFHKVLINGVYAWLYGAGAVNGTLLGFGERTGNPPIEGLIIDYMSLKKERNGVDPKVITKIGNYYRNELGDSIPISFPFVGSEFNTTRAGIHADGLIKNEEIYNIFDTTKLLDRPMGVAITDKSGAAGVALWMNNYLKYKNGEQVTKDDPNVIRVYELIMEEYDKGRTTSMSNEEMEYYVKECFPKFFDSEFERLKRKAAHIAVRIVEDLAATDAIKSMDVELQEPAMEKVIEKYNFIQFLYVVNREGIKTTRNIVDPDYSGNYERGNVGIIYTDREWFSQPIKTGTAFVSDFLISRITNRLCITVSAPIRNAEDRIVGVLGIDIAFEALVRQ
ncbi:MAG: histone-lysine N-methyltransferase [Elusimicrobia bacterium]|nr:histone-lysine N-methyltransferase [Elusimicrobiota bacterium]